MKVSMVTTDYTPSVSYEKEVGEGVKMGLSVIGTGNPLLTVTTGEVTHYICDKGRGRLKTWNLGENRISEDLYLLLTVDKAAIFCKEYEFSSVIELRLVEEFMINTSSWVDVIRLLRESHGRVMDMTLGGAWCTAAGGDNVIP